MAWQQKSRSNSEGRTKMGLVMWEAGKEQNTRSPCTSLLSDVMPNTLTGMRSWIGDITNGSMVR